MRKRILFFAAGICVFCSACDSSKEDAAQLQNAAGEENTELETEEQGSFEKEEEETQFAYTGSDDPESEVSADEDTRRGAVILDQSFGVSLAPLGEVRFVSYAPEAASGDAVFTIEQNGEELMVLEGMKNRDVRVDESFEAVEAVSFPDYNGDGLFMKDRPRDILN